jgi:hypothetical protein
VEPVALDLDGADRAEALAQHVQAVQDGERGTHAHVERAVQLHVHGERHREVEDRRANGPDQHAALSAEAIHQRAHEEEPDCIGGQPRTCHHPEGLLVHQRSERHGRDRHVVAPHVEERIRHPQREPVDESPPHELLGVPQRVRQEVHDDDVGEGARDEESDHARRVAGRTIRA